MTDIWIPATTSHAGAAWPLTVAAATPNTGSMVWLDSSIHLRGSLSVDTDASATLAVSIPLGGTASLDTDASATLRVHLPVGGTLAFDTDLADAGFNAHNVATTHFSGNTDLDTSVDGSVLSRTHLSAVAPTFDTGASGDLHQRTHFSTVPIAFDTTVAGSMTLAVPLHGSISADFVIPDTIFPPANDSFANATLIIGDNGWVNGYNVGATAEAGEPGVFTPVSTVWYRWVAPTVDSMVFFADGFDTVLTVWTGTDLATLSSVASNDAAPWAVGNSGSQVQFAVTAGTTYYLQVDGNGGDQGVFRLGWSKPVPVLAVNATVPLPQWASATATLQSPADGGSVPVLSPTFTVAIQFAGGNTYLGDVEVNVDYSTDATFATHTTVSSITTVGSNTNVIASVPITTPLLDTLTYHWRATVTLLGYVTTPTPTRSFTVNAAPATAGNDTPLTWTISNSAARQPHLWYAAPLSGFVGQSITVVGHGVTDTPGTVTIGGVACAITTWTRIPATPVASPFISTNARHTDAEHYQIIAVVPNVSAPGGLLVLEG